MAPTEGGCGTSFIEWTKKKREIHHGRPSEYRTDRVPFFLFEFAISSVAPKGRPWSDIHHDRPSKDCQETEGKRSKEKKRISEMIGDLWVLSGERVSSSEMRTDGFSSRSISISRYQKTSS